MSPISPGHYRRLWQFRVFEHAVQSLAVFDQKTPVPQPDMAPADELDRIVNGEQHMKLNPDRKKASTEPELSEEQKAVAFLVLEQRKNVFFTGSAGTGKSVLLRHIVKSLRRRLASSALAITATTGIAAVNIGGSTLHSFAGVGLGQQPVAELVRNIKRNKKSQSKWEDVEVLLIDEISMLSASLLTKLNEIAKKVRKNTLPFGGIQLVVCGDMFQLPPVSSWKHSNSGSHKVEEKFVFQCDAWRECIDKTINLTQVFRQQDNTFANMLNELRLGRVSEETEEKFRSLCRPPKLPKGIVTTKLYPTKAEVDKANQLALERLCGTIYEYHYEDWFNPEAQRVFNDRDILTKATGAEKVITLKVGAQVMLTKNLDGTLVNGSTGTVIAFVSQSLKFPKRPKLEGQEAIKRAKHEDSQTDDFVPQPKKIITDSSSAPDSTSVAQNETLEPATTTAAEPTDTHKKSDKETLRQQIRSKIQTFQENLPSSDFLTEVIGNGTGPKVRRVAEDMDTKEAERTGVLPLVKFYTPEGDMRYYIVKPESWTISNDLGTPIASRTQLPLILAWALSIHKSQGQTIPFLQVNLNRTFERGQAYVALSRATKLDTLQVLGFSRDKVKVDKEVINFYQQLDSVNNEEKTEAKKFFQEEELAERERQVAIKEQELTDLSKLLDERKQQLDIREAQICPRECLPPIELKSEPNNLPGPTLPEEISLLSSQGPEMLFVPSHSDLPDEASSDMFTQYN